MNLAWKMSQISKQLYDSLEIIYKHWFVTTLSDVRTLNSSLLTVVLWKQNVLTKMGRLKMQDWKMTDYRKWVMSIFCSWVISITQMLIGYVTQLKHQLLLVCGNFWSGWRLFSHSTCPYSYLRWLHSLLDLVLTNKPDLITDVSVINSMESSDHNMVAFSAQMCCDHFVNLLINGL